LREEERDVVRAPIHLAMRGMDVLQDKNNNKN